MSNGKATVQSLARELRNALERKTRKDDSVYVTLREGSPQWMKDAVYAAHENGEYLPDDWRYQFILEAASALTDAEDPETAEDSLEADPYTGKLTAWLASNVRRVDYVTDAMKTYSPEDGFQLLAMAQIEEMREVMGLLRGFLVRAVEEREAEE